MSTTEQADSPASGLPRHPRRRRRWGRWVGWSLLLVVVLLLVAAGLLARDALTARTALLSAMDQVPAAEEALRAGDVATADAVLADVQPLTAEARASTDGPLWSVAAYLPLVGQDVRAFSAAAATVDDLAATVLPSLTQALAAVEGDALTVTGEGVDLAPLVAAAPGVADAARAFDEIDARLATVDADALHAEVADPYGQLVARTDDLRPVVRTADRLTALGPAMLGADGPRRYLLLALNNAELRAGGGIPGSLVLLTVDGGRVTLERQASTADVPPFDAPVLPLGPGVEEVFTDRVGRFVQDTPLTPDFPTTAALTATMWEQSQGETLDGVVATDPVVLSYLLGATGPLAVDFEGTTRTIEAGDVVSTLLSDAYAQLEAGPQTDAFFGAVAERVLSAFLGGEADPGLARDALVRGAEEHRVLVWSAHADEQERLSGTVVAGDIDTAERAESSVGVFLNDATGGKMSYYLDTDVQLTGSACTADGRVDTFRATFTSTAPPDAATSLPWYVTGGGISGVEPGRVRTLVVLYPPRGGQVDAVRVGGSPAGALVAEIAGRRVSSLPVELGPGESTTVTFTVPTAVDDGPSAPGTGATVDVWTTPTVSDPGLAVVPVATCG